MIKIKIGTDEIAALWDLGVSVSTIPKSLFNKLNLGSFEITELKLYLEDSTSKQAVGIKENTLVYVKGCPALIDFVIVDMPEDATAPIILGRTFLRTIKALINLHEGNVKLQFPSWDHFCIHFPRKKEAKHDDKKAITLKANEWVFHSSGLNKQHYSQAIYHKRALHGRQPMQGKFLSKF